jgi:hypothetical protein
MNINVIKLIIVGALALACVIAIAIDNENQDWAAPVLTLLIGYVVGNAAVTSQEGTVAPIIGRKS